MVFMALWVFWYNIYDYMVIRGCICKVSTLTLKLLFEWGRNMQMCVKRIYDVTLGHTYIKDTVRVIFCWSVVECGQVLDVYQ